MRKSITYLCLVVLMCGMLTACKKDPEETVGPNGMTLSEVRVLVKDLDNDMFELLSWLNTGCRDEYDDSFPPIPDSDYDHSFFFNWRAVKRFQTMEELYAAFEEVFSPEQAKVEFRFWGSWEPFDPYENNEDYETFEEINGRLYVVDNVHISPITPSPHDFGRLEIKSETEGEIIVNVPDFDDVDVVRPAKATIVKINGKWVFSEPWNFD